MTHATILTVWMSKGTVRVAGRGPRQISLRTPSRAKSTWLMRMKERTVARLAGRHAGRDTSTTPLQDRKRPERFTIIGAVAQRLEQRTHNPLVLGSNPSSPNNLRRLKFLFLAHSTLSETVHAVSLTRSSGTNSVETALFNVFAMLM